MLWQEDAGNWWHKPPTLTEESDRQSGGSKRPCIASADGPGSSEVLCEWSELGSEDSWDCNADVEDEPPELVSDTESEAEEDGALMEDGGGRYSDADWLGEAKEDCKAFGELRAALGHLVDKWDVTTRLDRTFAKGGPGMFSPEEVASLRELGVKFVSRQGLRTDSFVEPGQPFTLGLWSALLSLSEDLDAGLPEILRQGVQAGVFEPIAPCDAYEPEERVCKLREPSHFELEACSENWKSADNDPGRVAELLREEVDAGWMELWEGDLEDAFERWGKDRVAVGKLALIVEPGKADRLVGDSSVAGVSPCARFPNRMRHPRVRHLKRALCRCRRLGGSWVAIALDVSAAHKRMKMCEVDGGLGFFQLGGCLYRYLTCFFGASYSAFWWGRVSGALMRLIHKLLGAGHVGMAYVDDSLIIVRAEVAQTVACVCCAFLEMLGVPVSYHKLQVSTRVEYIGVVVDLEDFSLGISETKAWKLSKFLGSFKKGERLNRLALAKGIGSVQWATDVLEGSRPWLSDFYRMLNKPGLVWRKLEAWELRQVFVALDGEGKLRWNLHGFKEGLTLSFVGKRKVRQGESWYGWAPHSAGCVAFADWTTERVRVTAGVIESAEILQKAFSGFGCLWHGVSRKMVGADAAADAMATGQTACLGGWWMSAGREDWSEAWWWHVEVAAGDLGPWFSFRGAWSHDIVFWEALAQLVLFALRTAKLSDLEGSCEKKKKKDNAGRGSMDCRAPWWSRCAIMRLRCWQSERGCSSEDLELRTSRYVRSPELCVCEEVDCRATGLHIAGTGNVGKTLGCHGQ